MTRPDDDRWLRAALAPARELEPTPAEVSRAAARAAAPRRWPIALGGAAHAGRGVAFAVVAVLLAATAAAAATGLIPVGSVFRGQGFESGGGRVSETVVARGVLPGLGAWRMTTFETKTRAPCLKLSFDDPPRRAPRPHASGYCGWIGAFSEFGHGRRAAAVDRGSTVLFGHAPEGARVVELIGRGGELASAETQPDPNGAGGYWVLTGPTDVARARLAWRDGDGRVGGTIDVSHRFEAPSGRTVVATGRAPHAGRWRMTVHESRRRVVEGDLYSPEGLPCITLRLLDAGPGMYGASGYCGVQPRTPGFTRGQSTVRSGVTPTEILVYGRAPERADTVEVTANGKTFSTPAIHAPRGVAGRYWLIAGSPRELAGGEVRWVDGDGGARGRPTRLMPP